MICGCWLWLSCCCSPERRQKWPSVVWLEKSKRSNESTHRWRRLSEKQEASYIVLSWRVGWDWGRSSGWLAKATREACWALSGVERGVFAFAFGSCCLPSGRTRVVVVGWCIILRSVREESPQVVKSFGARKGNPSGKLVLIWDFVQQRSGFRKIVQCVYRSAVWGASVVFVFDYRSSHWINDALRFNRSHNVIRKTAKRNSKKFAM